MTYQTTMSSKYRVTIPKAVRLKTSYKPGQKFTVLIRGKSITLVPTPQFADIVGIAPGLDIEGYRDEGDAR